MHRIVNRSRSLMAGALLVGATLAGCAATAPDWTFTDAEGTVHSLSDFRGSVVVLGFTNSWCEPCIEAAPHLQNLHETFSDRGVKVVAVNAWEQGNPIAFMKENGYTYSLLLDGTAIARQYRVSDVPTFYVIGVDGRVVYHRVGFNENTPGQMTKVLERYLQKHEAKLAKQQLAAQRAEAAGR